jgi:hypothetical protein
MSSYKQMFQKLRSRKYMKLRQRIGGSLVIDVSSFAPDHYCLMLEQVRHSVPTNHETCCESFSDTIDSLRRDVFGVQ